MSKSTTADAGDADAARRVAMMAACAAGKLDAVNALLRAVEGDGPGNDARNRPRDLARSHLLAAGQDPATGESPLMVAAARGHGEVCVALLDAGAPWNAVVSVLRELSIICSTL